MPDIDDNFLKQFAERIQNANAGDPFTFAGKLFKYQYLTADEEEVLYRLVVTLAAQAREATIAEMFLAALPELRAALAVILTDQDPECTEEWIGAQRGIPLLEKLEIVLTALRITGLDQMLVRLTGLGQFAALFGPEQVDEDPLSVHNTLGQRMRERFPTAFSPLQ